MHDFYALFKQIDSAQLKSHFARGQWQMHFGAGHGQNGSTL